ncbi:MAG: RluA family pseudouridine synthase [Planctomycetes bacterium]|nr:RluA family pseudouridine synthase [Planctomycetota bacterium]
MPVDDDRIRGEVVVERELTQTHRIVRFTVPKGHAPPAMTPQRLDRYLHAILPTISRTMIRGWLDAGAASVDGRTAEPRMVLKAGHRIELRAPLPPRLDIGSPPPALEILYRDQWLMACNKPPGQLAHQAGKTMSGTLLNALQEWMSAQDLDPRDARLINRIDRDTSGIVLVSLDPTAHTRVAKAMEARDLHKEYRAICHGAPDPAHGSWLDPIGEGDGSSIARIVTSQGQPCHTDYETLETAGADDRAAPRFATLRVVLHTGRQHQIRVHAAHHGNPLVGDWVYGQPCAELPGQALHSALLVFAHPMHGSEVRVEAPLPAAFVDLWSRLRTGAEVTPTALSDEQRSKLGQVDVAGVRRPSWLSAEEFAQLRAEAGE